jgi:hypothetical protein
VHEFYRAACDLVTRRERPNLRRKVRNRLQEVEAPLQRGIQFVRLTFPGSRLVLCLLVARLPEANSPRDSRHN